MIVSIFARVWPLTFISSMLQSLIIVSCIKTLQLLLLFDRGMGVDHKKSYKLSLVNSHQI